MSKIEKYWQAMDRKAASEPLNYKEISLPLARIKRLMKVEEGVKMVASEVPILLSKVTENFVEELTLRSWVNTDESKRRILQRGDITAAIRTSDVYDFLIYIIPRSPIGNTLEKMGRMDMLDAPKHMDIEEVEESPVMQKKLAQNSHGFMNTHATGRMN